MLYLKEQISESLQLGIWKIEEPRETLYALLDNKIWLSDIITIKSESRIVEMLAVRALIKEMIGKEVCICYTSSGRPYLEDKSYYISISHTKGFVAVLLNTIRPIAIDIEQISDKAKRVRKRFVSEREYIDEDQEILHLLLHWSAKETLFKILDVEGVDFLRHLYIEPFTPQVSGIFGGSESKTKTNSSYEINYKINDEFVLTYLIGK